MKQSNWVSSAFPTALLGAVVISAVLTYAWGQDIVNYDQSCMDATVTTIEKSEEIVKHRAKISQNVRAMMAHESDQPLEVIIVLNVSKPDLSHVFDSANANYGAVATNRQVSFDKAVAAVTMIVRNGGGQQLNVLRNAASVLVRVDRATLEGLEHSQCVAEIVENARLRE